MNLKRALVPLALVAALGIAACGDDDDDGDSAGGEPTVTFTSPTDGETTGDSVTAEVELDGFQIDAANVGMANAENQGHLHFSLDGGKYDKPKYSGANGELAVQLGVDGQYSPSTEPTITYSGLPAGEHTLEVDLVNNDHSETGVSASTTFTVESGGGSASTDSIEVRDFEFSPASQTVAAGTEVRWENTGAEIHTVKGDGFFSRAMNSGDTYEHKFAKSGTYDYVCTLHPQMQGEVVVE